jgi:aryl-alcohol dehydrogenase-like predicted oxidoreductase
VTAPIASAPSEAKLAELLGSMELGLTLEQMERLHAASGEADEEIA